MAGAHPEEIECFRMPSKDGTFSPDKRYEYTYATRKSWEYIPALGRQDWRYFTNKGFTYAGKWLRSEQSGQADAGDYWEVFFDDRGVGREHNVQSDYDGMLCWREYQSDRADGSPRSSNPLNKTGDLFYNQVNPKYDIIDIINETGKNGGRRSSSSRRRRSSKKRATQRKQKKRSQHRRSRRSH